MAVCERGFFVSYRKKVIVSFLYSPTVEFTLILTGIFPMLTVGGSEFMGKREVRVSTHIQIVMVLIIEAGINTFR